MSDPTLPEESCPLCWLKERHEVQSSQIDLCLAMAFNLGRLMDRGLVPAMCERHVALIQRQLGDLRDQVDADPDAAPDLVTLKALDS